MQAARAFCDVADGAGDARRAGEVGPALIT
jgi:hypothetical protein